MIVLCQGAARDPLENLLAERAWVPRPGPALVMTAAIADLPAPSPDTDVRMDPEPDPAWLALYRYRGQELPPIARTLLLSAPWQAFASVRRAGRTVAVGRVSVADQWGAITAVEVDACLPPAGAGRRDHRRASRGGRGPRGAPGSAAGRDGKHARPRALRSLRIPRLAPLPLPRGALGRARVIATFVIMATRARNGSTRPRGGPAEAAFEAPGSGDGRPASRPRSRTGTTTRGGAGSKSGGTTRRGTTSKPGRGTTARSGKKKNARGAASKRRPAKGRPARRPADPVVILITWTGRAIAAAWMVVAGAPRVRGPGDRPRRARPGPAPPPGRRGAAHPGRGHRARGGPVGTHGQPGRPRHPDRARGRVRVGRLGGAAARRVAGLALPAPSGPERRDGPRRDRLDRAAARRARPGPSRQGHAAAVRRPGGDARSRGPGRLRGVRPAGRRRDALGGGAAAGTAGRLRRPGHHRHPAAQDPGTHRRRPRDIRPFPAGQPRRR